MTHANSSRLVIRVADTSLDPSCYDLLASEAAIGKLHRGLPREKSCRRTGFASARSLTPVDRGSALVSWSGSMFEYLMPALVMRFARRKLAQPDVRTGCASVKSNTARNAAGPGEYRSRPTMSGTWT